MKNDPYVFITHSSQDEVIADQIRAYLESHDIACWIAPRDIPVGEEWAKGILNGINNASGMLLVFSSHSNNSPQVRREIERAIHNGIPIFPIRIEDVKPSDAMEYYISSHHWMDAFEGELEQRLAKLVETIAARLCVPETGLSPHDDTGRKNAPSGEPDESMSPMVRKAATRKQTQAYKRIVHWKIVLPVLAILSATVCVLFCPSSTMPLSGVDAEYGSEIEPFTKVFSEAGAILDCQSMEQTLDGGFLLSGQREPADTTETWIEHWVMKLDDEGNIEWELSIQDSLPYDAPPTGAHAVEMQDSTIAFVHTLPLRDSLMSAQDMDIHSLFNPLISYTTDEYDNDGIGFRVVHVTSSGELLSSTDLRWPKGRWEVCWLRSVYRGNNDNIYVAVGCEAGYPHLSTVLFMFPDISTINMSQLNQYSLANNWMRVIYSNGYIYYCAWDYYIYPSVMYQAYVDSVVGYKRSLNLCNVFLLESPSNDSTITPISGLCPHTVRDSYIYNVNRVWIVGGGSYFVISKSDAHGHLEWYREIAEYPNSAISDIAVDESQMVVFAGSAYDSSAVRRPFIGMLNRDGDMEWYRLLPFEGRATLVTALNAGSLVFCVDRIQDYLILRTDSAGNCAPSMESMPMAGYSEDWSSDEIGTEWRNIRWGTELVEMNERDMVLKVYSGSLLLDRTFNLRPGMDVRIDILVRNALRDTSSCELVIVFPEDTAAETASIPCSSLKWNFGETDDQEYSDRSILTSTLGHDATEMPDSLAARIGEWNSFRILYDSTSVGYYINGQCVSSDHLPDSVMGHEVQLGINVQSSLVPLYIDSIGVEYK